MFVDADEAVALAEAVAPRASNIFTDSIAVMGRQHSPSSNSVSSAKPLCFGGSAPTILQFASHIYFCHEEQGVANVEVMRIGNPDTHAEVTYVTSA